MSVCVRHVEPFHPVPTVEFELLQLMTSHKRVCAALSIAPHSFRMPSGMPLSRAGPNVFAKASACSPSKVQR